MKYVLGLFLIVTSLAAAVPPAPPIDSLPEKHQANLQKLLDLYTDAKTKSELTSLELSVLVRAMSRVPGRIIKLYIDLPEIKGFVVAQRAAARQKFFSEDIGSRVGDESLTPTQRLQACNLLGQAMRNVANFQDRGEFNDTFDDIYQGVKSEKDRLAAVKVARTSLTAKLKDNTKDFLSAKAKCTADYKAAVAEVKAALKK